jgi:phosphatidate cytidylyltransferase
LTRLLSALILLPVVIGIIWFLPPLATLVLAEVVVVLAFLEFAALADGLGAPVPRGVGAVGAVATCAAVAWPGAPVDIVLMAATVAAGAMVVGAARIGRDVVHGLAATLFGLLYIGLPIGALAAVRIDAGPGPAMLLLLTIVISDSAQYYGGRSLGRRLLAPAISPKKTVEGAVTGFVVGTAALMGLAAFWLPDTPRWSLLLLGPAIVALGIAGDLFESVLKRSAGVKDASSLIPGHGGILDRIDALLFAAPVYYTFVTYSR